MVKGVAGACLGKPALCPLRLYNELSLRTYLRLLVKRIQLNYFVRLHSNLRAEVSNSASDGVNTSALSYSRQQCVAQVEKLG